MRKKMSSKLLNKTTIILLTIDLLCLTPITTYTIVEVPPENYENLTNDYRGINESVLNIHVQSEIGTYDKKKTIADQSAETMLAQLRMEDLTKHKCNRKCSDDAEPMICTYDFRIEHYQTMSKACHDCPFNIDHCNLPDCIPADGVKRQILIVNRQMPGPSIEVCLGDIIEVQVTNMQFEETTSIHWHGLHQRGYQFMDGVPGVTQCAISPGASFFYRFNASTPGTHFWHSHSGFQRGDGVYGALIVRLPPSKDQFSHFYDYDLTEHVMNIQDWTHHVGLYKYLAHYHSDGDNKPASILVNGKGQFRKFKNENNTIIFTPMETFTVKKGYRYKFRLINSGSLNCPIEVSVDNHTLVIINSDGSDLDPVEVQSLVSYAGERFDFIIHMNQEIDNYWIRFRGLMDCDERYNSVFQTAILNYEGVRKDTSPAGKASYNIKRQGLQANSLNVPQHTLNSLIMSELNAPSTNEIDVRLKPEADLKFYISYDFYPKDNIYFHRSRYYGFNETKTENRAYTPQLNHISMMFPPFPLMANLEETNKLDFCNSSTVSEDCKTNFCECIHVLRVPLGSVVELIIIDKGFTYDANHPFHLHGNNFRVIGMDRLGLNLTEEKVRELDVKGLLNRNLENSPIKDTVNVPDGGYTIIRWHASNPGFWLFHCHIEFHMEIGMALIFKVGEDFDIPPVPKNFPQCGNYYPVEQNSAEENKFNKKNKNEDDIINLIRDNYLKISSQTDSLNNSSIKTMETYTGFIANLIAIVLLNLQNYWNTMQ